MKQLTLTLEEELCILDKYELTPNELLVLRAILLLQDDGNEELFRQLLVTLKRVGLNLREILVSLQHKSVILKSYRVPQQGEEFDPFAIAINKNFVKALYKSSFEMGKELFDEYPQFGFVNGVTVGLRAVSKKFDSLEQAYFKYGKAIGWSPEKHNHIIELLKWAKENNIINYTLASFIVDERWHELESLKNGDAVNVNRDAVKML